MREPWAVTDLFEPLTFTRGPDMKNRVMLAPLTNSQSHPDGRLSDDDFRWLTMRAQGGFGLTMTAAAHVQAVGQGFPNQVGVFGDEHLEGLTRLADAIRAGNSVSVVQLHHAGNRSPAELVGTPVCPSDDAPSGARALTTEEVEQLVEDFIAAAVRSERAGFDGVEVHGAHGYIVCQFLSSQINQRTDRYGGSLENRSRVLFDIVAGIRQRCGEDFNVGVRLSPERFGMKLGEIIEVAQRLMDEGAIDYLDMSLWDVNKEPEEDEFKGRSLMSWFTDMERGDVRLGVAGQVRSGTDARRCLDQGCDFVLVGRAAIVHHDWPDKVQADAEFTPIELPVTRAYLDEEGLSEAFINYMAERWDDFVSD
ncbi:MAG: NADH:flavin oxidoreductase [Actinomycetia bacterium]|nr:NADH:flavin oxidoreductase [Actinomycetes bacterium]MCP4086128.1 NADH:flavin oxidoreductase [Actinomycetes bacterium]